MPSISCFLPSLMSLVSFYAGFFAVGDDAQQVVVKQPLFALGHAVEDVAFVGITADLGEGCAQWLGYVKVFGLD
jgi:hypothetical protein